MFKSIYPVVAGSFVLLGLSPFTRAQSVAPAVRIRTAIDESRRQTLRGNTHPLARSEFDAGPASADLALNRMILVLNQSPEQASALGKLLDAQQDPTSPRYHNWLTPEQFGQQFGASDTDIQTIAAWLQSHGFKITQVAKGKRVVEFSGTASQVADAFHTEIHKYVINGVSHWANSTDPQIPIALTPVVAGVSTLHNFVNAPQLKKSGQVFNATSAESGAPQFTSSNGLHALAPADYAVIYNINPLYQQGITGAGTTIAVVGRTNVNPSDLSGFRSAFGLTANIPQVILNGADPGDLGSDEEAEAILDSEWSGAVATGATVDLVVSASTSTTDGTDLSEEYIIDNNLGDVMTESFGDCEANYTAAQATFYSTLAQQAAAQGITYLVASGDSGAEGCDSPANIVATGPVSPNILASNPYVTAVGGTVFNENNNDGNYWRSSNTSPGRASALSYIPEDVWNDSCSVTDCGSDYASLYASGGGASGYYAKPSWQAGVAGIPNDGARDTPDVSLSASGHDPYLVCIDGSCPNRSGRYSFSGYSGTSAATPSFAGIMALIVQKTASRQGQANYRLYKLAATENLSSCNASSTAGQSLAACIFNDVTNGDNSVPGEAGYGTLSAQYQAGIGYDLATGLGSVNVTNLATGWNEAIPVGTPAVSFSRTNLNFGAVTLGSSSSQVISVSNPGTAPLSISQVTLSSPASAGEFSQTSTCGVSLAAGASCTVTISFSALNAGFAAASLTLVDNAADSPQTVAVTATAASSNSTSLSSSALNFGNQRVVSWSAPQSITVTNTTSGNVSLTGVSAAGANPADFTLVNGCAATVPAGASCTISVIFNPQLMGARSASLSITASSANMSQTVSLAGVGTVTGLFQIINARTGKVLEVVNGSPSSGTLIQQYALDGLEQQQWELIPLPGGYYQIVNALTQKALDNTLGSLSNGNLIQQYDSLGDNNQQWQFVPVDDVHYAITNRASGKVLDMSGGSSANGALLQQWDYNGNTQQLWTIVPVTPYNIASAASASVLEIADASAASGALIQQDTPDGFKEQQWNFVPVGSGFYAIINRVSGKVLDVTGGSSTDGTLIQQYDYLNFLNQHWQFVFQDVSHVVIKNRGTGKVLDLIGGSSDDGTEVQEWDYLGNSNQQWQLTPITFYSIINRESGNALDVTGSSTADGTPIQQWSPNGQEQQQWQLVSLGSGFYGIVNNLTSKVLDVTGASTSNGALVQEYDFLGSYNQLWQLVPTTSGAGSEWFNVSSFFEIVNANSGYVLDVVGRSTASGALIQQFQYLGGANQQWQFVPTGN